MRNRSSGWMVRLVALLALASAAGACHGRVVVRPDVIVPAQIPVRSFPSIWVAGGTSSDDMALLDRVAQHLATDRAAEVRRVDMSELEPARQAGAIPVATVVLALDLRFEDTTRTYVGQQPVQYCGITGCWVSYANYVGTTQVVIGNAKVTVYDGPTARVLQERTFTGDVAGNDGASMRASVVTDLAQQLSQAVDMLRTQLRIPVARGSVKGLDPAVKLMRRGRYAEARAVLEAVAQRLGGHKKRDQSAVWYDLGVARWFSRGDAGLDAQTYADTKRAFTWATRAYPNRGAERALRELETDWQRQQIRIQQEQARALNFSLAAPLAAAAAAPSAAAPSAPSPNAPDAPPAPAH